MLKKYFGDRVFWQATLKLAIPIALQNLLLGSFTLVDTLMIGQLGDVALAGVGMAGQWSWLMNLALFGLSSGSAVFIAQFWGVGDLKKIRGIYGIMLIHTLLAALIFFGVGAAIPQKVVWLFNSDPAVMTEGGKYLQVAAFSYFALALGNTFSTVLRSTENVKLPLFAGVTSAVLNAVLNYCLIFGKFGFPQMGVQGAALATCISAWASPVFMFLYSLFRKTVIIAPLREIFGFGRALLLRFYKISSPVVLNESLWALGTVCYNMVFGRMGYEYYAAVTIQRTIEGIAFVFFIGLCNACCVMVGKSIGAGETERGYTDAVRFTVIVPAFALVIGTVIIAFRSQLTGIFNLSGQITETTVNAAQGILFVYAAEMAIRNIPYITIVGVFRSGGDTAVGMKYDLICVWLIALPLTVLSAFVLKLPFVGVYAVMLIAEDTLKVIACIRRLISKKWIKPLTNHTEATID